jgi:hypothetical protein
MATVRGREEVSAYFAAAPAKLINVLRGAGRAGAAVISDEIKANTPSDAVRDGVRIRTKTSDGRVVVTIDVKPGWARAVGTWLEYGTAPHFISVDDSQRNGMSVGRVNKSHKAGSIVIGGQFVGATVFHPGARAHPTFRPALDLRESDAVAAAQGYINSRISRAGIMDANSGEDSE